MGYVFRDEYRRTTMTVVRDGDDGYVRFVVSRELEDDDLSTIRIGLELDPEALIPLASAGQTALSNEVREFLDTADEDLASASSCPTCGVTEGVCVNLGTGNPIGRPHRNRAETRMLALTSQRLRAMKLLHQVVG